MLQLSMVLPHHVRSTFPTHESGTQLQLSMVLPHHVRDEGMR